MQDFPHRSSSALMKGAVGDLARESWYNAHIVPVFLHLSYLSHFRGISKSFAHNRQELRVKIAHNRQELWTKFAHNRQERPSKVEHLELFSVTTKVLSFPMFGVLCSTKKRLYRC